MAKITRGHRVRSESGNAVLELAFTLPLLLVVVMGIFDFGFMFQHYELVTNAAREGARVGVLPGYSSSDATTWAGAYLAKGGIMCPSASPLCTITAPAGATCTISAGPPAVTVPCITVTVRYTYTYNWIGPILNLISGGSSLGTVILQGVSVMRVES